MAAYAWARTALRNRVSGSEASNVAPVVRGLSLSVCGSNKVLDDLDVTVGRIRVRLPRSGSSTSAISMRSLSRRRSPDRPKVHENQPHRLRAGRGTDWRLRWGLACHSISKLQRNTGRCPRCDLRRPLGPLQAGSADSLRIAGHSPGKVSRNRALVDLELEPSGDAQRLLCITHLSPAARQRLDLPETLIASHSVVNAYLVVK